MAVDFEAANAALFARLSAVPGIAYTTRILESWADSAPAKWPALMLTSSGIDVVASAAAVGAPPLWKMRLDAVLYAKSPDPAVAPSTILNPLIAAVCNALLRQPNESNPVAGAQFVGNPIGVRYTTLGGRCASCMVAGTIEVDEGVTGHASAALIPIELVLSS